MSRKTLTISVAAYNMEEYIRQCLNSLVIPEIIDELEVLVIDDGGTDDTLKIVNEYAEKFPRTFIPIHKGNGGWGSTVNYSITHATGEYFKILDGDDWFDRDGLVELIKELRQTEADVVATYYSRAYSDRTVMQKTSPLFDGRIQNMSDILETLPILLMHNLCYRTAVLRESGLTCPEHMLYCDTYYAAIPLTRADTIQLLDFTVYFWRSEREGQSISDASKLRHQDDTLSICHDFLMLCAKAKKRQDKNYIYFMRKTAWVYHSAINVLRLNPTNRRSLEKIKVLDKFVQDTTPDVWEYSEDHCGKFIWLMRKTHYLSYWLTNDFKKHV